jgi:phospho-N-acetylmuramoyl-pentapeptide-transferase
VWLGFVGFLDDYIKVFKKDKRGLAGKFKVVGQIGVGIIVGSLLYFNDNVVIKEKVELGDTQISVYNDEGELENEKNYEWKETKSTKTTIPFVKNNEFDYKWLLGFLGDNAEKWSWIIFIPMVILIVTAVSNGANITDGIDGLATGTSAIIGVTLAIFAYLSGNAIFADYLNILYIPNTGELVIFISAFIGACIGFLWYNAYPAKVFMGDTGSLALGGIIATFAIAIRKELLIPIFCGIFLIENLSVMIQVAYFKYTKKKYGEGRRIFLMSPLHHHYQKKGIHEAKIVARFWIVGIILAVLSIVTLKVR